MYSRLPWFIWQEIMELTVADDKPEYCLLNKTWFKTTAGRFITILDVIDSALHHTFSASRWFLFQGEEIKIKRFNGMDWDYLANFKLIKHVNFQHLYSQPDENLEDFFTKFNQLFQLEALTLELTKDSYTDIPLDILFQGQPMIKYLYLDIEADGPVYNNIFGRFIFKYVTSFKFRCRSDLFSLEQISCAMPHLKYLHIIFSRFDSLEIYQQDFIMRGLKGLRIEHENDRLLTIDLDLSEFPDLKRLSVPRETNFLTSRTQELCPKIESLDLSHPNEPLLDQINITFPLISSLSINCYNMDTGMMGTIFNLLPRLNSLTLYEVATDTLLIPFELHNTNLKYLKIDGYCYMTNNFILWLSENFQLQKLHLKYFTDCVNLFDHHLKFEDLESLVLEYIEVFNTSSSVSFFSNGRFPKLKFFIKKRFNASSTRSNNQRYAYIKGITG